MGVCAGGPSWPGGGGPSRRNLPARPVVTPPLVARVYTPFAFDCQNETRAPATGVHAGDSTMPVRTWPVPIFARSGGVPRFGPYGSFAVGLHAAEAAPANTSATNAEAQTATMRMPRRYRSLRSAAGPEGVPLGEHRGRARREPLGRRDVPAERVGEADDHVEERADRRSVAEGPVRDAGRACGV